MLRQKGFTLIELIAVIILLGILSVSAVGKFSRTQDNQTVLLRNQLLSSLHYAQQLSLAHQDLTSASPVQVQITPASNSWSIQVQQGAALVELHQPEVSSQLRVSASDFSSACSALPQAASQTISFTGKGDLQSGSRLRLCLMGESTQQICIAESGYAYQGAACL